MDIKSEKVLIITKDYTEEKSYNILGEVQNLECDSYFVDDVVSIKTLKKDIPVVGRITNISDVLITVDCSKNFKSKEIEIAIPSIKSIKMWDCPENVMVRRHIKSII